MCEMWWWCQTFSLTAFSGLWHWCFRGVACRACWGHWVVTCREQWVCCRSGVSKAERCSQHCAFGSRGAWPSGKQCTLLTCDEMCGVFLPGKGLNIQQIVIWLSYLLQFVRQKVAGSAEYRLEWLHKQRTARFSKNKHIGHSFATAGGAQWVDPSECSWLWQVYPQQAQLLLMKKFRQLNGTIFLQVRINLQNTV